MGAETRSCHAGAHFGCSQSKARAIPPPVGLWQTWEGAKVPSSPRTQHEVPQLTQLNPFPQQEGHKRLLPVPVGVSCLMTAQENIILKPHYFSAM